MLYFLNLIEEFKIICIVEKKINIPGEFSHILRRGKQELMWKYDKFEVKIIITTNVVASILTIFIFG